MGGKALMPLWRSVRLFGAAIRIAAPFMILLLNACGGGKDREVPRDPRANLYGVTIASLRENPQLCTFALGASGHRLSSVPDRPLQNGCGITNAIEISGTSVDFNNGFVATCPLAATYAIFEADVLQAAAQKHFGQAVTSVEHWGTYACRNRNNRTAGPRSEHATGNAIDIASFTLADGRRVTVLEGWRGRSDERAFLREIHQGACSLFQGVIGPDNDAAHRDHLHLDMGRWRFCR